MFTLHLIWIDSSLSDAIHNANYIKFCGGEISLIVCSPLAQSVECAQQIARRVGYGEDPLYVFPFIYELGKDLEEIREIREQVNPLKTLQYPEGGGATFINYAVSFIKKLLWVKKNMFRK